MHTPKWALFFDFHTMPACPDVGAGFDADAFADRVKACGVDYIVFPAKCNLGMAYYDTRVDPTNLIERTGIVYAFVRDEFGGWTLQAEISPGEVREGAEFGQWIDIEADPVAEATPIVLDAFDT